MFRVPSLWPSYIGKMRTNFAEAYGIKARCYWELFALTHLQEKKNKLAWKVHCLLSKWKVNNGLSTLHTKHNLKEKHFAPLTHKKKREALSLHTVTSHWFHRNCIPKIGCHYFWPRLIALLISLDFVNNFAYIRKFKLFKI